MDAVRVVLAGALSAILAAPAGARAAPPCDDARAVAAVKAAAAKENVDVSTLQLVVEGPYGRAKFLRTHPTFRTSPALRQKLAKHTFYFVWFHPPFMRAGAKGSDVWGLVDVKGCGLLHLARE